MIVQKISVLNQIAKKQIVTKKSVIPFVTLPLVAYTSVQAQNTKDLKDFFFRKGLKWPDYVHPHPDTKEGISYPDKHKITDALEDALKHKRISEKEFNIYSRKVPFTGSEDGLDYDAGDDYSTEIEDFKESLPYDTDLSPELNDILKAPSFSSSKGLMTSILGEDLVNKFETDLDDAWDVMSHIKQMTIEVLGLGD